jgi:hypothetical protein
MNPGNVTPAFLRVAEIARQTTGLTAAADTSSHDSSGLWLMRDAQNASICEISPDGTVVEAQLDAPPLGLLDRIRDLRACGLSTRAIHNWFGTPQSVDQMVEARVVFKIAMEHLGVETEP